MTRRAALAAGLALAIVACGDDGRALRDPPPGATAPPVTESSADTVPPPSPSPLVLNSPAFNEGTPIPTRHTCDGARLSPPLGWGQVPADTFELAITMTDADAGGFVHWVVTGLDPAIVGIGDGALPEGTVEGRNDSSEFGWFPPCPPPEDGPHRYVFTLYALTEPSALVADTPPLEAIAVIGTVPGVAATLSGTYDR